MQNDIVEKSFSGVLKHRSYGGKSLLENIQNADKAIAKVEYTEKIWDRSRSQFMLKFITCSQADVWMRLRQVSAEMSSKRRALNEAKFNYMEMTKKAEIKISKIPEANNKLVKDLLEIQAGKLNSQAEEILIKMEGAMKEVETLAQMHDSLKDGLGKITEEEYEKAQAKAHIKRAVMQATREMREFGVIKVGNQEYLEQCGVCVTAARKEIGNYLKQEAETAVSNTSLLHDFLDDFAERYEPVAKPQAEWLGFNAEADMELTYTPDAEEQ